MFANDLGVHKKDPAIADHVRQERCHTCWHIDAGKHNSIQGHIGRNWISSRSASSDTDKSVSVDTYDIDAGVGCITSTDRSRLRNRRDGAAIDLVRTAGDVEASARRHRDGHTAHNAGT